MKSAALQEQVGNTKPMLPSSEEVDCAAKGSERRWGVPVGSHLSLGCAYVGEHTVADVHICNLVRG
jgi:hypothetical protein